MAPKVAIVPATLAHLGLFARELTATDHDEARALGLPDAGCVYAFLMGGSAESWAGLRGDRVGFMMGVSRRGDREVHVWFHCVELFRQHGLAFSLRARSLVEAVRARYGTLRALVPVNSKMIRFMEWLGFSLGPATECGPLRQLLHPAVLLGV